MNIVFLHGHRATNDSFNFISAKLPSHRHIFLTYDSDDGFFANHKDMVERLEGVDDVFFVAHSLGGIHALHLANELQSRVLGAVTISTPYGGSEAAEMLTYLMPFTKVFHDIHPRGAPIVKSQQFELPGEWTNIVSVRGHSPMMATANDGVLTRASMQQRDDIRMIEVEANHYEVLLNAATVTTIRQAIREVENDRLHVTAS